MAADTIRFIVTVAIVVYKGLIPVVGRMLTEDSYLQLVAPPMVIILICPKRKITSENLYPHMH